MKVVELTPKDFEKIVNELKKCREERELLIEANKRLNEEIKEYNKKFANKRSK